ncbi:MAG: penicillin-binding protein 2 [Anaerolineae bacterium]|jgi:penicillin-binding protein 2
MIDERRSQLRFLIFRIVTVLAFAAITFRLWDLQVVSSDQYQEAADRNRFRLVPIDAPRGIIYDRFGRMLVRNVPSFTVNIIPAALPDDEDERRAVLERVAELLEMPVDDDDESEPVLDATEEGGAEEDITEENGSEEDASTAPGDEQTDAESDAGEALPQQPSIERILRERTVNAHTPVRIASNVDREVAFIIEEEQIELPGVIVEAQPLREYIDGPLTAHLLGYVGAIPSEQLPNYTERGYLPNDMVGLMGLERTQDEILRGVKGQKHIEVDAFEREVAVIASQPPVQGHSLILTIDLELQRVTESALRKGMERSGAKVGVAIAMDPRTGEVLSIVSLPNYDNNLFSGGIDYEDYARLIQDPNRPMVNHAISSLFPPGSTFKVIPAVAGLQEGVINRSTTFTCRGTYLLPNRYYPDDLSQAQPFYCWNRGGHGTLNVTAAIAQSCNIFFNQMVGGVDNFRGLGMERLADYMHLFGFGALTGIELPGETPGLVPDDRWKRQTYGESWLTGDSYNAAIGQGYVLSTPLQLLNATAAIANGGTLNRPQIVYQVIDAEGNPVRVMTPDPIRQLPVSPEVIEIVRQGMRDTVARGTARHAAIPGIEVAGKTGTAEYPGVDESGRLMLDRYGNLPTHAWFTAFAPFDDPEIAVVVFLQGGGEGSRMSVPVANEIMRHYFAVPEPEPQPVQSAPAEATPPAEESATEESPDESAPEPEGEEAPQPEALEIEIDTVRRSVASVLVPPRRATSYHAANG